MDFRVKYTFHVTPKTTPVCGQFMNSAGAFKHLTDFSGTK